MGMGMDLAGRRKDGTEFPVEIGLSHIETAEGMFAIAFVNDIGTRKRLEGELLQAQKMEAVGRLAGGVAHDFNNMLTVMAGYTRMILDGLPPVDPLRAYAEEALQAAGRATAITRQLLAFSRRQVMQPCVMNLNATVRQTESMLRRLIGEDIELALELGAAVGNIQADPNHIEQAIVNLALNARDAMARGGRITIGTAEVRLDEAHAGKHAEIAPGDFAMLSVSDTGHGMDAETRRHVFEPFFTTKETGKGTGLGLATVYGTVKQLGGDIRVYSEPGQGTTFKLYFPLVSGKAAATTATEQLDAKRARRTETVLVVEDEDAVRDLTVKMLRKLGHTVLAAANGAEAIRIAGTYSGTIALLVTDVVMPNMSGREVADRLLEMKPALKVLYVSGYTDGTVVHHGELEGSTEFLPKPFSREGLAQKIRQLLDGPEG
jgi:signal transduction histidine kinase/CheY-like chemotaxis protein